MSDHIYAEHIHEFITSIVTRDHYYDYEVEHCVICDNEASKLGLPTNRHFEHPKGCKCYWCVWCVCDGVVKREAQCLTK